MRVVKCSVPGRYELKGKRFLVHFNEIGYNIYVKKFTGIETACGERLDRSFCLCRRSV